MSILGNTGFCKCNCKNVDYLFFRNPPLPKIVTPSLGQKSFDYFGKCDYFGCCYHGWGQYIKSLTIYQNKVHDSKQEKINSGDHGIFFLLKDIHLK